MVWNRRLWMRLGALSALLSLVVTLVAVRVEDGGEAALLRLGATIQFAHALAVFACAGFMAVGARRAADAPALFLGGSPIFGLSLYARALGQWDGGDVALAFGVALMAAGWGVLIVAAGGIDRDA